MRQIESAVCVASQLISYVKMGHIYVFHFYAQILAHFLATLYKLKDTLLTEELDELGGGLDRFTLLSFLPQISPKYRFFHNHHNQALETCFKDDETNTLSCVQDSSAEHYQENHIPIS